MLPENLSDLPVPGFFDALSRDDSEAGVVRLVSGYQRGGERYAVWRSRGRSDWLLMYTRAGCGRVGKVALEPGDIALIRPGALHDYGTARDAPFWEILWTHFQPRPHWLSWLGWPEEGPGVLRLRLEGDVRERVEGALWEMHRRAVGPLARREDFAMHALEEALLWCETATPAARRLDPRVEAAMRCLLERLGRPVTLPEVAREAGLSVSRLSFRFKAEVGQTPMQFLEAQRLARARQLLLLTARPVASIAAEVGFESPIHFSLRFRKIVGVSPRAFRNSRDTIEG